MTRKYKDSLGISLVHVCRVEKPYSSLVCEFGGFENVLRDAIRAIPI